MTSFNTRSFPVSILTRLLSIGISSNITCKTSLTVSSTRLISRGGPEYVSLNSSTMAITLSSVSLFFFINLERLSAIPILSVLTNSILKS
ncbi:unnamed protein product [Meloidogyne enterolobii]|uniref:Uncharacterized protein n=1 Tax=Meloidogyne enterolobii TaxID=390850 RepID=A0ACB0ZG83_MELEN